MAYNYFDSITVSINPVFLWLMIILAAALISLLIFSFFYTRKMQRIQKITYALKMKMFLVKVPQQVAKKTEEVKNFKEVVGVAEQFLSSLYSVYKSGWQYDYGIKKQNHFIFEIANINGEISFYIAFPDELQSFVEKQILSFYPAASLEEVDYYNPFIGKYTRAAILDLKKSYVYPIKTYLNLESEPLNDITNALSKLSKDEAAAITIGIRPISLNWRKGSKKTARAILEGKSAAPTFFEQITDFIKEVIKTFSAPPKKEEQKEPVKLSPLQEKTVSAIEEKAAKIAFATTVRIIVSSNDAISAEKHLSNIVGSFTQFVAPEFNGFIWRKKIKESKIITEYILREFSKPWMILNTEEIASLFHFPNQFVETPHINWLLARHLPPPTNLPTEGRIIGENIYRGVKKMVMIKPNDRRRHIYVIGKTGTGKSTLLESMAIADIKAGEGICYLDPLGDSIEHILMHIPKERADDVILFDPSDMERPLGLNLFEFKTEDQKDFLIQEAINILYKLYDPGHTGIIGPRFENWFRNGALTIMSDPAGATILEVPRVFTDNAYAQEKLQYVTDPLVKRFWTDEMAKTSDFHKSEILGWFTAKFGAFIANKMMRNIMGQTKSAFDIRQVMDEGKILLLNLSKGKIGDINAQLLGMIIVAKIQMAAFSRADMPEEKRKDFYLYVDEFQDFTTDSFAAILSQARKYRLNLIITNQYIAQLPEQIRDAVIGNVGTLISFRIGAADAEFLIKEFPGLTVEDMTNIPSFHAYIKLLIDNAASRPFTVKNIKPSEVTEEQIATAQAIKQLSRLKYGKERAVIEQEIFERAKLG